MCVFVPIGTAKLSTFTITSNHCHAIGLGEVLLACIKLHHSGSRAGGTVRYRGGVGGPNRRGQVEGGIGTTGDSGLTGGHTEGANTGFYTAKCMVGTC